MTTSAIPFTITHPKGSLHSSKRHRFKTTVVSGFGSFLCLAIMLDAWRAVEWFMNHSRIEPNTVLVADVYSKGGGLPTQIRTTPLHLALQSKVTMAFEADIHAKDNTGTTPWELLFAETVHEDLKTAFRAH